MKFKKGEKGERKVRQKCEDEKEGREIGVGRKS